MGMRKSPSELFLRETRSTTMVRKRLSSCDVVELHEREEKVKHIVLAINLALVVCKGIALSLCAKLAITQSLFDSLGDVIGNVAVIAFRDEIGVLMQAIVMGLASVGVIIRSAPTLLELIGFLPNQNIAVDDGGDRLLSVILIAVAIVTKGLVWGRCRMMTRRPDCGRAVQAIQEDAVNDVVMNSGALICAFPEVWLALSGGLVSKTVQHYLVLGMDPAWSFLMSLPILHGWYVTGMAQIETLRNEARGMKVE